MAEKFPVYRIITDAGIFYAKDVSQIYAGDARILQQDSINMTEEEYLAIPTSEDARRFFAGERMGSRAPE